MAKLLAILLWPAGIAVVVAAGTLLTRRLPAAGRPLRAAGAATAAQPGRGERGTAVRGAGRFLVFLAAGFAVIYVVMVLLAAVAVHVGPAINRPVFHWTVAHRLHAWERGMRLVTGIGNGPALAAAASTAAVALAVTWRRHRWLPPVAMAALLAALYFLTLAISHTVPEAPPPVPTAGGFPSGGCASVVALSGLIAYLLWREFSGQRRAAVWAGTVVVALGFSEGYSRGYVTEHWFLDILGGLLYGGLLLLLFIAAVRFIAGPVGTFGPAVPTSVPSFPRHAQTPRAHT